jgi:hypothetical protein
MKKNLTKRKSALLIILSLVFPITLFAQHKVVDVRKSSTTESSIVKAPAKFGDNNAHYYSTLQQAPRKDWGGMDLNEVLIDEDFSAMTTGTNDAPDESQMLASFWGQGPEYIDASLTKQDLWEGNKVYSAGGAVALLNNGVLNTPLGDYSGDLTITITLKALKKDSYVMLNVVKGGYSTPSGISVQLVNLYADQGWKEVILKVHNTHADNDGFFQVNSSGNVLIDNIRITSTMNFIAKPVIKPETNFTKNSFTANWQKVRVAGYYNFGLYKRTLISDKDSTINENFENVNEDGSNLPKGWDIRQHGLEKIETTGGEGGTKGLIIGSNDTIATPFLFAKLKSMKVWMHISGKDLDPYALAEASINIEGRTINGWEYIGSLISSWFYNEYNEDLMADTKNMLQKYYGIRLTTYKMPANSYLVVDNFDFSTNPPAKLETVIDKDTTFTKELSYTATGLDSLTDYYYSVASRYYTTESEQELHFAFGLSTPVLSKATDIDSRGRYTANWKSVPKATRYLVNNFGVYKATADETEHAVLDEDFSKINSEVTNSTDPYHPEAVGNQDVTSLEDFTNLPGWEGYGNTISQGMIGAQSYYGAATFIRTPGLYLANDDKFVLSLKAYGTANDCLGVIINNNIYQIVLTDTDSEGNGFIDGVFDVPECGKNVAITFYSKGAMPFMLDNVKVSQNLKAGSFVYTYLSSQETKPDVLNAQFTNLDKYDYGLFAYNVYAYYDLDGSTAISDASEFMHVNLEDGSSVTNLNPITVSSFKEYFTIDGKKVSSENLGKGIYIVREHTSNGIVTKKIIR